MSKALEEAIEAVYRSYEGSEVLEEYAARHGIDSAGILTVYDDERAGLIAEHLEPRIKGKVVVEIGAGIGLLACHLAGCARHVFAIEASPLWASLFSTALLARKPKNCTYILGAASEMEGILHADLALFCTHSDVVGMRRAALLFAPVALDVYGEILPNINPRWKAARAMKYDDPMRRATYEAEPSP